MQTSFCMWHGLTFNGLCRVLRCQPRLAWSYLPRWFSIAAMSVVNSLENVAESAINGRRIRNSSIRHPPLFILGHWRSGTTLLHNLMALDTSFSYLNLYQSMCPGHFLLTEPIVAPLTSWCLPKTRPMDNMPLGWNVPMEDEMAVAVDCCVSPYLMAAFQDRFELYERFLEPERWTDKEMRRWEQSFLTLLKKLQLRDDKPVLLKSPTHTFRIPTLLNLFPEAKFIYLFRDPYAVIRSTLHLRRTMLASNSLEPPHGQTALKDTLELYERCIRRYEQTKQIIPANQLCEMRFEDLELDPLEQTRRVYEELQLSTWDEAFPAIGEHVKSIRGYRKNDYTVDRELKQQVLSRFEWVCELYRYSR